MNNAKKLFTTAHILLFGLFSFLTIYGAGEVDPSFSAAVSNENANFANQIAVHGGKTYISGEFTMVNGQKVMNLAGLNPNGSLDAAFNPPLIVSAGAGWAINSLVVQGTGKIIIGGQFAQLGEVNRRGLARLNPDGSPDSIFNSNSSLDNLFYVYNVARLPNNNIVFAGQNLGGSQSVLTVLHADGNLIASINTSVVKVAAQSDGKILVVSGLATVRRYNQDLSLDASFTEVNYVGGSINDIEAQPDGKILVGGSFTSINGDSSRKYLARLNSDGSLDTSFSPILDSSVFTITREPNGKILIGGAFSSVNGTQRIRIARLYFNGTTDFTFDPGAGANSTVHDIALQADRIILVGQFTEFNGVPAMGIVRLLNEAPPPTFFDYDGDGRSDISVFRASENKWYILQSSDLQVVQKVFAQSGDIPVPSDFDGDGKTDLAVFRPSTGDWWIQSSRFNSQIQSHWGQAGDIPLPSNFDNTQGVSDLVLYRPSNSVWYRYSDIGTVSVMQFGIAEDKPLIGDFDGDGRSDLAVFRPSTGDWWYAASGAGGQFIATHWGATEDIPVPADYDGDGKTDFAVFRPSDGGWYILNSGDGSFTILAFGLSDDKPVAADYDGDGKADIAVFRPSTGVWYLMQTSAGFSALQFGISTDIPTPNSLIH